jgi:membrane-bound lytic murein transglycosylase D
MNEEVAEALEELQKSPYSINKWLERSARYAPLMKGIFRRYGLPEELFYVAVLESGFDPHAVSKKDAGGPWQFIPSTARKMGMRIDEWVDERKDFEKSTIYAAKYFSYFFESFSDWHLALAGYNCGGAPVRSAIKKCGNVTLWEMAEDGRLTFQARSYVPRIIAVIMVLTEPEKYGFTAPEGEKPFTFDRVFVPGGLPLSVVAEAVGVKTEELTRMNPELLKGVTPPDAEEYEVKIPIGRKRRFLENFYETHEAYRENLEKRGILLKERPGGL